MATDVVVNIIGNDADFQAAASNVENSVNGISKSTGSATTNTKTMSMGMTELNSTMQIFNLVLGAVRQAYDSTVAPAVEYNDQVRQLGFITGVGAVETSKLMEVTGDLGISFEALNQAATGAARKGISMNIESLADLSSEYLALAPGQERAKFLLDTFGRSGASLAPLLAQGGSAIRQLGQDTKALADSNTLANAQEYNLKLIELNDTFSDLSITIGNALIPILTWLLDGWNSYFSAVTNGGTIINTLFSGTTDVFSVLGATANAVWQEMNGNLQGTATQAGTSAPLVTGALGEIDVAADNTAAKFEGITAKIVAMSDAGVGAGMLATLDEKFQNQTPEDPMDQSLYDSAYIQIQTHFMGVGTMQAQASLDLAKMNQAYLDGPVSGINTWMTQNDKMAAAMTTTGETTDPILNAMGMAMRDEVITTALDAEIQLGLLEDRIRGMPQNISFNVITNYSSTGTPPSDSGSGNNLFGGGGLDYFSNQSGGNTSNTTNNNSVVNVNTTAPVDTGSVLWVNQAPALNN
jgi:hypothetical protein